jgi:hypothetical protein
LIRGVRIPLVVNLGVLLAVGIAVACGDSYGENADRPPPGDGGGLDAEAQSTTDGSTSPLDAGIDTGIASRCPGARFVDPLDDSDLLSPFWSRAPRAPAAGLSIDPRGGVAGTGALVASVEAGTADGRYAYVSLDRGPAPAEWTFCLSFAIRVPTPTVGYVTGPRLITSENTNGSSSVILAVNGRSLYLGQFSDGCPDGGASCRVDESVLLTTLTDSWTVVRLQGSVSAKGPIGPFGMLTATLDDRAPMALVLLADLHGYSFTNLRIGVSNSDEEDSATLVLDDVVYSDSLR